MAKKLLALVLVLSMLLGTVNVFAVVGTRPYSPGIWEYDQELSEPVEIQRASASVAALEMEGNGVATYDFTLPFDAAKMTVTYTAKSSGSVTVITDRNEYSFEISKGSNTAEVSLAPERMGAFRITFKTTVSVTITDILYTKIQESGENWISHLTILDYKDTCMEALRSSVVFPVNSNTINVKNALRRVDMENPLVTTITVDGTLYSPFTAFAHAFGMYMENYPDLNYAYMSGETFAWYFKGGESWYEQNAKRINMKNSPMYMNNILYVPVREIAEAMGHTVEYRDGFAVVGMRTEVRNIVNNESIFSTLVENMKSYIITDEIMPGKTYHVALTGSDSNEGTEAKPFRTIQKAADEAHAGDTVIIHAGVYRESVTFKNDGTPIKPIVFKAAEREDVTISAFEEVSGNFIPYTNPANNVSMYVRDVSGLDFEMGGEEHEWKDDRNFLLYKDKTLLEGRHPNDHTSQASTQTRYNYKKLVQQTDDQGNVLKDAAGNPLYVEGSGYEEIDFVKAHDLNPLYPDKDTNEILPTRGDMRFRNIIHKGEHKIFYHDVTSEIDLNQTTPNYWKGATVIALIGMAWSLSVAEVDSSEYGKVTIKEDWKGQFGPTYYEKKYESDFAWLTNHLNTVDKDGEWYIDSANKKLYIIPPADTNAEDMKIEVKTRQQVMDLTDRKYIQIENINSRGGGMTMHNAEGCILNGGKHKYISQINMSTAGSPEAGSVYGTEVDAPEYGEMGFYVGGQNNAVINTDIEYSAGAGIFLTGRFNYLYNNFIDKTGFGCTYVNGIYMKHRNGDELSGGYAIYNNTSKGAYRAAFGVGMGQFKDENKDDITRAIIPFDVAYNEWAWSTLASRDTGLMYTCYLVGGDDQEYSKYHHNVTHDSASSRVNSILHANNYFDGGAAGVECYNNIAYSSSNDWYYRARQYYYWGNNQGNYLGTSLGSAWSNWSDEFPHPNGLEYNTTVYANGLAFKAGALRPGDARFMDNYNNAHRKNMTMLADAELTGGAYITDDNYVVIPTESGKISGTATMGNEGTVFTVYYSEDLYGKTLDNCPKLTLKILQNGSVVWEETKTVAGFGKYMDSGASINYYIPASVSGSATYEITTDKESMRFRKISAMPFNYTEEEEKRDFPYVCTPIVFGSADRWTQLPGHTNPQVSNTMTSEALDTYTYSAYSPIWNATFYFDNRVFDKTVNKVVLALSSNYSTADKLKARVNMTNTKTGTVYRDIAVIDCAGIFRPTDSWHTENIEVDLSQAIPAGTYNIEVQFRTGGGAAYALIFF